MMSHLLSSVIKNDDLIDNRIDIKFKDIVVTIYRITVKRTTYTESGVKIVIEGDFSPDECGKFKHRSFEIPEHFTDFCVYKCDYDNITINSAQVIGITVTKKSNMTNYFNRLSQKD